MGRRWDELTFDLNVKLNFIGNKDYVQVVMRRFFHHSLCFCFHHPSYTSCKFTTEWVTAMVGKMFGTSYGILILTFCSDHVNGRLREIADTTETVYDIMPKRKLHYNEIPAHTHTHTDNLVEEVSPPVRITVHRNECTSVCVCLSSL